MSERLLACCSKSMSKHAGSLFMGTLCCSSGDDDAHHHTFPVHFIHCEEFFGDVACRPARSLAMKTSFQNSGIRWSMCAMLFLYDHKVQHD